MLFNGHSLIDPVQGFLVGAFQSEANFYTIGAFKQFQGLFIDLIRFAPGINLTGFRGRFFVDTGFADIRDVTLTSDIEGARYLDNDNVINISSVGAGISWSLGWVDLNFDFSRVTDFEQFYGSTIFQFWMGREF